MSKVYDVLVVGGGPAGLFATFYAGVRELQVALLEADSVLGGRIRLFQELEIRDVAGQLPIKGRDFITQLVTQANTFSPTIFCNQFVEAIEKDELFNVKTKTDTYLAKTIIVATGNGYLEPKKLAVPQFSEAALSNVHYRLDKLDNYKGDHVCIVGHSPMAIDWALQLHEVAQEVVLIETERLAVQSVLGERLLKSTIERLSLADVQQVTYDGAFYVRTAKGLRKFQHLLSHTGTKSAKFQADFKMETGKFAGRPSGETEVPGLFAAGDVLKYDGKLQYINGAFHDAMNAVNYAAHYIDEKNRLNAIVSTHNPVFEKQ